MFRILLVEDNEMNRDMLVRRLERSGYSVLVAGDGARAIEVALSERPDLIIMDMSLPVLDGWEATSQLRAAPETKAIPILALTAHAVVGDRERALAAGCDEYESKPFDFQHLLIKIHALLHNERPA